MSTDRPRAPNKLVPTLAVAAALVVLAAAGWSAWHFLMEGDGGGREQAAVPPQSRRDAPLAAESAGAKPQEVHGPSREADPETAAAAADPATVAAAAAAERYGIAVKVVRHKDGLAVPGASVFVFDSRKTSLEELPRIAADPIEQRSRASARLRTDENGLVRVQRPVWSAWVLAFDAEGRGCVQVEASSFAPLRLELLPRLAVAVRVVDESGAPCRDVEVALVRKGEPPRESWWRATSGADGLARIADADLEYSRLRSDWKAPKRQPLEVGTTLLLREPPTVPVDLDALPKEPLELRLPATGALAFQVVDTAGEPFAAAGSVRVVLTNLGELDVALDLQGHGSVPRVALDHSGEARPTIPERKCEPVQFVGPARAGETVDVKLTIGEIGPIVVGRVVDAAGTPLGGYDLDSQLDAFDRSRDGVPAGSARRRVKTEVDGAIRLDYSRGTQPSSSRTSHQLWLRAKRDTDDPLTPPAEALFDVVVPASGEVDVGVVTLALPPLIVAGRVLDDDGQPVEAARVRVQIENPPKEQYHVNHLSGAWSASDGRYEIRGEIPAGRLKVSASRNGYLASKEARFSAGDPDVPLTLRMGGGVAGSVRMPEGFVFELLHARLLLASNRGRTRETQRLRPDGSFEFALVAPELWDFELLLGRDANRAERLVQFHQVGVRRGELLQDPRLQELDLASLTHLVDVTVRVLGGDFAAGGAIGRDASFTDGSRGTLSIPLKGGRALVPCLVVPTPLQVVVPGFLAKSVRGSDAPIDVLLDRGYPLRLRVAGSLSKYPSLVARRVRAVPRDESIATVTTSPFATIEKGEATVVVPTFGRFRARIEFGPPPDPNFPPEAEEMFRRDRRNTAEVDFEVKDVVDEQLIELKVKG